ncbi:MAG TPA: CorA family divalent cation transporter [Gammaproteobacteria bacterium]|jgi:magnesium/cobalt transport protein CorA|nr:CorA family divalent cation transporter [Gammaproteobacteria bacterium]
MSGLYSSITEFDLANRTFKEIKINELDLNSTDKHKIYWIHCDLNDMDNFKAISEKVQLSEAVVSLCQQEDGVAKLIDDNESLTIRVQCLLVNAVNDNQSVDFGGLLIHLTTRYCLTASFTAIPAVITFAETYHKSLKYAKTPCFILFLLLDNAINDYSNILLDFESIADQIDLNMREIDDNTLYSEIMDYKKQVIKAKRYGAIIRDILMRISGRKFIVISEQCRLSLLNLFNHSEIIVKEADAIKDIFKSILDQIDNALIQKLSNTMRVLTAFAAIFLPVAIIPAIYGMNFQIPELKWEYGYFYALSLMAVTGILLFYFFKKKDWF